MRNYQQPRITKDIEKYIDRCNLCQRMKNRIEALIEKLIVNEVLKKPQIHLTVDFITKLPLVVKKNTIVVIYNGLFKIAHFVVITEETLVEGLVRLFRNNVWKLYRLPESVYYKLHLTFISTTSKLILTNQVVLKNSK